MEKLPILFGFMEKAVEGPIKDLLWSKGYEADIQVRTTKFSIMKYLEQHTECNVVVLKEAVGEKETYIADELAQLTELRDINVIVILSERHKGTEYMSTLHAAGITSALFHKGRKNGPSVLDVASLILQKRSRKKAREYYGIGGDKIGSAFLDNTTYVELYNILKKGEGTLIENFVKVCSELYVDQAYDFIRRLPKDDLDMLAQYEEFHKILQSLKKKGYGLKIKKPKTVRVGLKTPMQISMTGNGFSVGVVEVVEPEYLRDYEEEVREEKKAESVGENESLAGLLGYKVTDVVEDVVMCESEKEPESDGNAAEGDLSSFFLEYMSHATSDDEDDIDDIKGEEYSDFSEDELRGILEDLEDSFDETLDEEYVQSMEGVVEDKEGVPKEDVVGNSASYEDSMEEEDEEEQEEIVFDGYESSYDTLIFESGAEKSGKSYIILALIFLFVAIGCLLYFGKSYYF